MPRRPKQSRRPADFNAIDLALFNSRLVAVAEEMGAVLGQAAFSLNIKERRDFSCAIFDHNADMVSHAAHIPVHLGSTPLSVTAAVEAVDMDDGDVVILNDPYCGGTHLPDITMVAPVYLGRSRSPFAFVANRAHHADIGGSSPGSMALASNIYQEGLRIPPVHLLRRGRQVRETKELFLANTRVAEERLGDLDAQVAALKAGAQRIGALARRHGRGRLQHAMAQLQAYSARMTRKIIATVPAGRWQAEDFLDDDGMGSGPLRLQVAITRKGRKLIFDFAGSDAQTDGPLNANLAVTTSAVFYVVACLGQGRIPANRGMMDPVSIQAPEGSIVNCCFPAAVAGGNVETSQRIVDLLLAALAPALPAIVPAASCGSMTNIAMGGFDPRRKSFFTYYETVGGGAGAGPLRNGASAVQTHMTNTLNTPVEVLESYYPLKVNLYRIRRGSGGSGLHRGGDGIQREIESRTTTEVTLLAERRRLRPWGLKGGGEGKAGRDAVVRHGRRVKISSKTSLILKPGESIVVETPGGGGWSKKN
jgi:N-methylhydantoinase B